MKYTKGALNLGPARLNRAIQKGRAPELLASGRFEIADQRDDRPVLREVPAKVAARRKRRRAQRKARSITRLNRK